MTGSIEWRGNSCRLIVSCGVKDKKQIKKTRTVKVTGRTDAERRKEAERALAEFTIEIERGLVIDGKKLTFKEFVDRWLRDYAETNLAPKTLHRYKKMLNSRILPAMGHLKIDKIKPTHLLDFYANMQEDGIRLDKKPGKLSERTIHHHHRLISTILNDAKEWQLIYSNPAERVKAPKVKKTQAAYCDEEQIAVLLDAVDKEKVKYQALVHLALFTGLRRGEIMGLEWLDVDFTKGTIHVRQASQYLPGEGSFTKAPKNETSIRTISMPESLAPILKSYKAWQSSRRLRLGEAWQKSERVFTTWDGRPGHPEWPSQWFPKFIKKHNLAPISFHGLRHTSATLLIAEGADIKEVSGRLGHANTSTTGNIYAHFLKSADKAAAEKLDNAIARARNSQKNAK